MDLAGKSVVVTGGSSGIGRAASVLLGKSGCMVTVADLNETAGKEVVTEIISSGTGKAQFLRTDVADESSVKSMVDAAEKTFGKLDGAINAAGLPPRGVPLIDLAIEDWDLVQGVNLRGMFLCLKYQIPAMKRAGGGAIVAISSTGAIMGIANSSEYLASKAGVTGLVRGAAVEYAAQGIRINAILPGSTLTPMAKIAFERDPALESIIAMTPMRRWAQPIEIASAAVWLVSASASYVTGASWVVDGAMSVI